MSSLPQRVERTLRCFHKGGPFAIESPALESPPGEREGSRSSHLVFNFSMPSGEPVNPLMISKDTSLTWREKRGWSGIDVVFWTQLLSTVVTCSSLSHTGLTAHLHTAVCQEANQVIYVIPHLIGLLSWRMSFQGPPQKGRRRLGHSSLRTFQEEPWSTAGRRESTRRLRFNYTGISSQSHAAVRFESTSKRCIFYLPFH